MNRALIVTLCTLTLAGMAAAQDNKVTVPLSSPSQAATLKVHLIAGSIRVTAGTTGQVVIETEDRHGQPRRDDRHAPPGMHRIDVGSQGFTAVEDHNVVTLSPGIGGFDGINLGIQVPVNTSLELGTVNGGHVEVTGVSGEIDVQNVNGSIDLKNVSGSVLANTVNGNLTISFDRVAPDKPMSFSSLNGRIDVTLPADTKARLRLKTNNGAVFSDFDVKMEPDSTKPVVEDARGRGGRYRIVMERSVVGTINGGGPEYTFDSMNGKILIHKK